MRRSASDPNACVSGHRTRCASGSSRSAGRPMLLVIEDLHWPTIDARPAAAADRRRRPRACSARTDDAPGFEPPWPASAPVTDVPLTRSPPPSDTHGQPRRRGVVVVGAVVEQIVAKTDGIPCSWRTDADGARRGAGTDGTLPERSIPATLHDSLMARLDRLDSAKAVAQLASRSARVLARAVGGRRATRARGAGARTRRAGRRRPAPSSWRRARASYVFRHALIQDAAYESLLRGVRQQHHARIAEALASRSPQSRRSRRPSLHGSAALRRRHHVLATRGAARPRALGQRRGRRAREPRAPAAGRPPRDPGARQQELLLQTTSAPR